MNRSAAMQISGKLSYRAQLVAMWMHDPRTTMTEARRITGCPKATAEKVRRDLVARGVLKPRAERNPL